MLFLSCLCGAPSSPPVSIGQPCSALASYYSSRMVLDMDTDNGSNGRSCHVLHGWFSRMSELIQLHNEGLKCLWMSLGGRLLILIYFNKLFVFTKYRETCIFRADFPRRETSASLAGFGQWFQKLLGGHSETRDEDIWERWFRV